MGEVGCRHDIGCSACVARPIRGRLGIQPVAKLHALLPQPVRTGGRGHHIHPVTHALKLGGQNLLVPVALIKYPGHNHGRVSPGGRRRRRRTHHIGHEERHHAVGFRLFRSQIGQPRFKETRNVVEKATRRGKDLDVAGPAQALVALGAVGRDVEKVPAHAPNNILVETVDEGIRAFEPANALHVRMTDHGAQGVRRQGARPAFHLSIAEAVKGKAGLPGFLAAAAQGVLVGSRGVAQRSRAELPIFEHFGVAQRDGLSGGPLHGQTQSTDQILAKIHNGAPGRRDGDGSWCE